MEKVILKYVLCVTFHLYVSPNSIFPHGECKFYSFKYSATCLKGNLATTEPCSQRKTLSVQMIWSPEKANVWYLY